MRDFGWRRTWPDIGGPNARMLLVALCVWTDDQGEGIFSRKQLASFSGACTGTIDSAIATLRLTDCLDVFEGGQDEWGSYRSKRYLLLLANPRVRAAFDFWRPAGRGLSRSYRIPHASKQKNLESSLSEIERRLPETAPGPYKDSRASSSSIYLSIPSDFHIVDECLRLQVEKALNVVGRGADASSIYKLADSLVSGIPEAIAKGFNFEDDILPCLRSATGNRRSTPLYSFKVVLENDLPGFRERRIGRRPL